MQEIINIINSVFTFLIVNIKPTVPFSFLISQCKFTFLIVNIKQYDKYVNCNESINLHSS